MNISDLQYKDISRDLINSMLFENIEYSDTNSDMGIVMGSYSAVKYRVQGLWLCITKDLLKILFFPEAKCLLILEFMKRLIS